MRQRRHLVGAALILAVLGAALPARAEDTVSLDGIRGVATTTPEHGFFFKLAEPVRLTAHVIGSNYDNLDRVRVLAGSVEVGSATSRTGTTLDPVRGRDAPPIGAFYDITVSWRGVCGPTEIYAEAVYRDGRAIRSPGKRATLDCSPPTLRVESPTSGLCVKLGDSFNLQMTATDDLGVAYLVAEFDRLGRYGPSTLDRPPLQRTVTLNYSIEPHEAHGHGPVMVRVEAVDWGGGRAHAEFPIVLDGNVPPTIDMRYPNHRQRFSTLESILVEGAARDPGCGLDRVEIGARSAGTMEPFRVLMTVRTFSPEGYRVTLPPESLAPGKWDLRAAAFTRTGRAFGNADFRREIEVFRPIGVRPLSPLPPLPRAAPRKP